MTICSTIGGFASAGCSQASFCSTLAKMLRWSRVAPLETPVVPPVYCRKATSSRVIVGLVNFQAAAGGDGVVEAAGVGAHQARPHFLEAGDHQIDDPPFEAEKTPKLA